MSKPKIIAFYLPQYHPTPDNDLWWGKGFTEWTNVGKARPLFKGHYQPKVPADLGYYDLRLPEVREAQAELAKEAGIYGFCYYHYWFAGKEELELPFNEVLRLGKPDFPFMLCWANESWHKKFWNNDGKGSSKELLIEQTYPGEEDHINHFYKLLPAFKDPRYIRLDGKPAFMIYKPLEFPKIKDFIRLWNNLARKEGLEGIFFIGHVQNFQEVEEIKDYQKFGLNAVNTALLVNSFGNIQNRILHRIKCKLSRIFRNRNITYKYSYIIKYLVSSIDKLPFVFPTISPNWDHSPRSGKFGNVVVGSTPGLFKKHAMQMLDLVKDKKNPIVFLKAWNEWGEGNYMEPDLKYGKGYIEALHQAIEESK